MLSQHNPPLSGANLRRSIRRSFENILLPLGKADKSLLPARMDRTFRQRMERQIDQLAKQGLCRDIRLTDVIPLPKNDFRRWNDDGREWREALLQCSALERFLPAAGGRPAREIYRKNACLRVVQSRHIRHSDRAEPKGSYYTNRFKVNCPSCGAVIELNSQQVTCPYCGGVIESDFYDWQTEVFELYEEIGNDLGMALLLLSSAVILFVSVFLCLWLIEDTQISLAAGVPSQQVWGPLFLWWWESLPLRLWAKNGRKNWPEKSSAIPKTICAPASMRPCTGRLATICWITAWAGSF